MNNSINLSQLIPPFCPFSWCIHHKKGPPDFYKLNGTIRTKKAPFKNQRFKCKSCGHQFSENSFSIDFKKKIPALGANVLFCSMNGMSNNSIAIFLKVGETTVRSRLQTMARQSLCFEKKMAPKTIAEDMVYDGFETFTHSQYSPCYINTAVGRRSLFVYSNTLSPLNRKGRMTDLQKTKQASLLQEFGPYPRDSVFQDSCYIFREIERKATLPIKLHTDEHKSYGRALTFLNSTLHHHTTSSQARRDTSNPLFAINHLHLTYRHFFSSQQRETIAFQKHEAALLEKIQLMKIFTNFMKPKFVRKNKFDDKAHKWSPAMYLGLTSKVLSFKEVFGMRMHATQYQMDYKEREFLKREYPYSRQKIAS